ncbi:conserved hypothetical protein [Histoplasma capsulatum G186AR]|uniref:Sister chromatid cohesion protein Dcc1 n=1 Tax=Ajellomyces capsulatus (strain G186AR / H82 / ATCC MYA-2454 / RMSCC 2432) TaxID=447093 RepID=C0NPC3_AJECG|nr:uncharacterized protein HCBG_05003 [Histoplasma capsulatum G186AR]EEH06783.1 conserved hypothetical protein [Histoplasma capsulatum G186AR]
MAKPRERVLDFTHSTPQRALKLLELPPELAELISSGNGSTLYLKSGRASSSSSPPSTSSDAYVNLCTTTQTYMVRQVHSSNCIYLTQPCRSTTPHQPQQPKPDAPACITTIAKCNATLELVKMDSSNSYSAFPYLQRALRVYSGTHAEEGRDVDMLDGSDGDTGLSAASTNTTVRRERERKRERRRVMRKVFADVPLSLAECERGWVEMCGFVHFERDFGGGGGATSAAGFRLACWRPSAVVRVQAWKRVLDGAVLQGIDVGKQFLTQDLWRGFRDGDEGDGKESGDAGFPRSLFDALVRRLMGDPASVGLGKVCEEIKWASFDRDTTVSWVGESYLEANAPDPTMAMDRAQFMESWKDLLPESWRCRATWDNLKSTISTPDNLSTPPVVYGH